MNLILTSKAFKTETVNRKLARLIQAPAEKRLLLIDVASDDARSKRKTRNQLLRFGFLPEHITVFDETKPDAFRGLPLDYLYISGGNTFRLLDILRRCAFMDEITRYLRDGVCFIGRSAGVHVVTENCRHVLPFDENTPGISDFGCLRLLPAIVFCHYSELRAPYYEEAVRAGVYPVLCIPDDGVFVFDGENICEIFTEDEASVKAPL